MTPAGLVEELGLERAAVAELELERERAFARRDYAHAFALRGELAVARDHVVALELLVERLPRPGDSSSSNLTAGPRSSTI